MAEFCYECYKKILKGDREKDELVISKYLDLCEGCGKYKPVVIEEKSMFPLKFCEIFKK
jgi:hypothetical protein